MNDRDVPSRTGTTNMTVRQTEASPFAGRGRGIPRGQLYLAGARVPIALSSAGLVWESALCAQVDPEIFFPQQGEQPEEALEVCGRCPVRDLCRETFGEIVADGVVGGQTANERRLGRARRRNGGRVA